MPPPLPTPSASREAGGGGERSREVTGTPLQIRPGHAGDAVKGDLSIGGRSVTNLLLVTLVRVPATEREESNIEEKNTYMK